MTTAGGNGGGGIAAAGGGGGIAAAAGGGGGVAGAGGTGTAHDGGQPAAAVRPRRWTPTTVTGRPTVAVPCTRARLPGRRKRVERARS